jgi:hypothetical protein
MVMMMTTMMMRMMMMTMMNGDDADVFLISWGRHGSWLNNMMLGDLLVKPLSQSSWD